MVQKITYHLLIIIFALVCCTPVYAGDIYEVVSSRKLNMRESPSTSAPIVCQLSPGQEVTRLANCGEWEFVSVGQNKGYVYSKYIKYVRTDTPSRQATPQAKKSGSMSPTLMIIILIVVSGILGWLFEALDSDIGLFIQKSLVGSMFGGIAGLFSWWIFDNFFGPYLLVTGGLVIFAFIRVFVDTGGSSGSSFDNYDWNDYGSSGGSGRSVSYTPRVSTSHSYSYDDDDRREREEEEARRESNRRYFSSQADDAYREYQDYSNRARDDENEADTQERYAEDYENKARLLDDPSYYALASDCRRDASRLRNRAENNRNEAERYYRLYQENSDRLR